MESVSFSAPSSLSSSSSLSSTTGYWRSGNNPVETGNARMSLGCNGDNQEQHEEKQEQHRQAHHQLLEDQEKLHCVRERKIVLDGLKRDGCTETAWRRLPREYRVDKEFVLNTLSIAKQLPCKSEFERLFPQCLRMDRDVVLAFCQRSDFEELFYERHLDVPDRLTNDKQVMLAYCRKIPRSLQECSEDLTDDVDVVTAAISFHGLELQYASVRLQEDESIVRKACLKDGRALEFCPPSPTRNKLTQDRDFMLQVLKQNGGSMVRLLPYSFKRDRELLLTALAFGGMRLGSCPAELQKDLPFLQQAIQLNANLYLELPKQTQTLFPQLAHAAIISQTSTPQVHKKALELVPTLVQDRNVVVSIAKRADPDFIKTLFQQTIPRAFQDDLEIVLLVLQKDPKLYHSVSGRLARHPPVILAAMDASTAVDILSIVPVTLQHSNPEIVVKAIEVASRRTLRNLQAYIEPHGWRHKNVATAWIRRGGGVLAEHFEESLLADPEIALEIAQHSWTEFGYVSEQLRHNYEFMKLAVDRNGRVLRFVSPTMISSSVLTIPTSSLTSSSQQPALAPPQPADASPAASVPNNNSDVLYRDLAIRAIAKTPDAIHSCRGVSTTALARELLRHIQERLDLHLLFTREFLRGIAVHDSSWSISSPSSASFAADAKRKSQLPLLDQGVETSQAFKQLIAAYLGVPFGDELALFRRAHAHLSHPPPEPEPETPLIAVPGGGAAPPLPEELHQEQQQQHNGWLLMEQQQLHFLRRRLRAAAAREQFGRDINDDNVNGDIGNNNAVDGMNDNYNDNDIRMDNNNLGDFGGTEPPAAALGAPDDPLVLAHQRRMRLLRLRGNRFHHRRDFNDIRMDHNNLGDFGGAEPPAAALGAPDDPLVLAHQRRMRLRRLRGNRFHHRRDFAARQEGWWARRLQAAAAGGARGGGVVNADAMGGNNNAAAGVVLMDEGHRRVLPDQNERHHRIIVGLNDEEEDDDDILDSVRGAHGGDDDEDILGFGEPHMHLDDDFSMVGEGLAEDAEAFERDIMNE